MSLWSWNTMYKRILIILSFLMHGCVSIPNLNNEEKFSSISLESSVKEALADQHFEKGDWPSENWWEMFRDPQLDCLIQKALIESPTMQKAISQMKQAWQEANVQKAAFWPEIDFNGQDNWQYYGKNTFLRSLAPASPPSFNQIDLSLNFFYEIDFWGKNRHLFESVLGLAKAQSAETAQAALLASTAVALAYFDLQISLKKLKILKETREVRTSLLHLVTLRTTNALSMEVEKIQNETPLLDVDASILQYEQQIELDKHLISILVGQGPDSEEIFTKPSAMFDQPFPLPENITLNLIARRPDLMAQIWRVEAAAHQIGVAKTYFYPNVNLNAFGGLESLHFNDLFSWNSKIGSLLPAISLPIFTAGRLRANVNAKEQQYESAVYAYNELLLTAAKEVADQITIFRFVNEQLAIQESNLNAMIQRYDLILSRFVYGVADYLPVLTAEEDVLNQRLQLADLEYDRYIAALKLIKALGGGYDCSDGAPMTIKNEEDPDG
jgi:NodT family efflux transporter outer membrane factor (OMF) lipoprotein